MLGHGAFLLCPLFDAFGGRVPTRTLDFVHAVGYLHKLPEALSKPGELGTDYKRFKGILKKWGGAALMKNLAKTFGAGWTEPAATQQRRSRIFGSAFG